MPTDAKAELLIWEKLPEKYEKGTEDVVLSATDDRMSVGGVMCDTYVFDSIVARQMATDFYAVAHVNVGGVDYYSAPRKYSVLQYIYNKMGITGTPSDKPTFIELLQMTLEYGGAVQRHFDADNPRHANKTFYQVKVSGGTLSDGFNSGLYLEGDVLTLSANASNNGEFFCGWADSTGKMISSELEYTITVGTEHKTYTAVYAPAPTTYKFETNGAQKIDNIVSSLVLDSLPIPERAGYDFLGWYDNEELLGEKITAPYYNSSDVTLYAGWSAKKYTLTLDDSSWSGGGVSTYSVTYNQSFTLSTPTRENYTFLGWFDGEYKVEAGIWKYTDSMTLVAKWSADVDNGGVITPVHPW